MKMDAMNERAGLEARAPASSLVCEVAKRRLLGSKGDPFLRASWGPVVFFNYLIDPQLVPVRAPFSLELHNGQACVSLVAVTMRRLRPWRRCSLAWVFRPIREQRFLNLRTYVHHQDEAGALFLWGWLSRPFPMPIPSSIGGLSYSFAELEYGRGECRVSRGPAREGCGFCARFGEKGEFSLCSPGSLEEFALERYSGFFVRRGEEAFVFRAWHPPWLQSRIEAVIEDTRLVTKQFPWFEQARFVSAHFAPGFDDVWLGRPHRLRDRG